MIKAIFFDLDNTLIDFMRMKKACVSAAVDAMIATGLRMSKKEATEKLYDVYWKIGIEHPHIFEEFLKKVGGNVDYKILAAGVVAYRKTQVGYMKPYTAVVPTLLKLKQKGIKLAIVTDAPRLKAWLRLTELGLQDFFDAVVAFGDVKQMKPSKMPFVKALEILKLKASDVLMVGDMPEKDIEGARRLGMKTCFARYGYVRGKIPKTNADYEIDGVGELMGIVE